MLRATSEGGAFLFPGEPNAFNLLRHIKTRLGEDTVDVGVAFLDYCMLSYASSSSFG